MSFCYRGGKSSNEVMVRAIYYVCSPSMNDTSDDEELARVLEGKTLKDLVADAAKASNPELQLTALQFMGDLIYRVKNPTIDKLIMNGILPILVRCLSRAVSHDLQLKAAYILHMITTGTLEQTSTVVQSGAVPLFIQLLKSPNEYMCELAVYALGNIIAKGPVLRDRVIELGVVQQLLSLTKPNAPINLLLNVAWVFRNLCRSKDKPAPGKTIREIIPALSVLIENTDTNILELTARAVSDLTTGGNIQEVIDSDIASKLIPLLSHKETKVHTYALEAAYNVARATDGINAPPDCDVQAHVSDLLVNPNEDICWKAVIIISIQKPSERIVQTVIDAGLLVNIVQKLTTGDSKPEAARLVANLSAGATQEQVETLVSYGVLKPFCYLLRCQNPRVINLVLEGLKSMLAAAGAQVDVITQNIKNCGGLDSIKDLYVGVLDNSTTLLNSTVSKTYMLAFDIFQQYFADEEDNANLIPSPVEDEFQLEPQ